MITMHHLILGKPNAQPNTFIGGIGVSIVNKTQLASLLKTSESNIYYFKKTGNDIECFLTNPIIDLSNMFLSNNEITYIKSNKIQVTRNVDSTSFIRNCPNTKTIELEGFSWQNEAYANMFTIAANAILESIRLKDCIYMPQSGCVFNNPMLTELYTPNLIRVDINAIGGNINNLKIWDIKKCKYFGTPTSSSSRPIQNMPSGFTLNINSFCMTDNNGGANASLQYYKLTNNTIINFYDDNGNYVSTL